MSFSLHPRNSKAGSFDCTCQFWHWLLDAGVGLPIGYGPAFKPGQFVYTPDKDGKSPGHNDGCRITASQAQMMAACARGLAAVHRMRKRQMAEYPTEQLDQMKSHPTGCMFPVCDDYIAHVERFADWAEKSGGFVIW